MTALVPPTITVCPRACALLERMNRPQCACRGGLRGGQRSGSPPRALSRASNAAAAFEAW
jgi:hypothetical protein